MSGRRETRRTFTVLKGASEAQKPKNLKSRHEELIRQLEKAAATFENGGEQSRASSKAALDAIIEFGVSSCSIYDRPDHAQLLRPLRRLQAALSKLDQGHIDGLIKPATAPGTSFEDAFIRVNSALAVDYYKRSGLRIIDATKIVAARLCTLQYVPPGRRDTPTPTTILNWRKQLRSVQEVPGSGFYWRMMELMDDDRDPKRFGDYLVASLADYITPKS